MIAMNENIPVEIRTAPKLTAMQQERMNYNKWVVGHDMVDLRRFLEAFGVDWTKGIVR